MADDFDMDAEVRRVVQNLGLRGENLTEDELANIAAAIGSMRLSTPRPTDRIDRILQKLSQVWHAMPDQRLGQLLANYGFGHHADPFYIEDTEIEEKLTALLAGPVGAMSCPHPGTMRGEVCGKCGGTFGV